MIQTFSLDTAFLEDISVFERNYRQMPLYRRQKIDRTRHPGARRLSLAAGMLLKEALESAGFPGADEEIALGKYGKPFLPVLADRFQFSLSHSGSKAICVASVSPEGNACPVGCDIEKIGPFRLATAHRFFSGDENELLRKQPDEESKRKLFYRLWTLKESFIKATGLGLACPLREFSIGIEANGSISVRQSAVPGRYLFQEEALFEGYQSAWCLAERPGKAL